VSDNPLRATVVDTLGPPSSARDPRQACLILIYGDELGRRVPLELHDAIHVGRDTDCELVLDDETVSRRHARVSYSEGHYAIRDLGSTNGIFVNNLPTEEHALLDGDLVKIGRNIFKFLQGSHIESNYHEVIYQLMTNDGLTQAFNRRYFEQQLAREMSRASRYERPLALLLFDIDHFKQINDARGHLIGDEVLRQLANMVQARVRREDIFARVGGEEFAVLVPEGTLASVRTLAERLRAIIADAAIQVEGEPCRVTCSFGIASLRPSRESRPRDLYERADAALYAAKSSGRNCVRAE
jgi:diguanylate cyclase (GGDEF)-like protein